MSHLSLTSLFKIPGHMANYEVLSRASCFLLNNQIIATSQHVVAPYNFPNYYSADWVQHITADHVKCVAEIRDTSGQITATFPLHRCYNHASRDLSLLSFASPPPPLSSHTLYPGPPFQQGLNVHCLGHTVTEPMVRRSDADDSDDDNRVCVPGRIASVIALQSPAQTFLYPASALVDGYCGGPVVAECGGVVGMVEGIVPLDHEVETVRGLGSYVDRDVICKALEEYAREEWD